MDWLISCNAIEKIFKFLSAGGEIGKKKPAWSCVSPWQTGFFSCQYLVSLLCLATMKQDGISFKGHGSPISCPPFQILWDGQTDKSYASQNWANGRNPLNETAATTTTITKLTGFDMVLRDSRTHSTPFMIPLRISTGEAPAWVVAWNPSLAMHLKAREQNQNGNHLKESLSTQWPITLRRTNVSTSAKAYTINHLKPGQDSGGSGAISSHFVCVIGDILNKFCSDVLVFVFEIHGVGIGEV